MCWAEDLSGLSYLTSKSLHLFLLLPPTCLPSCSLLPPLALAIITAIAEDDGGVCTRVHSCGITMWVNFNSSHLSPHSPNPPDAQLRSAYLLYTGSFSLHTKGDKLCVWLVPVCSLAFSHSIGIFAFRACVLVNECTQALLDIDLLNVYADVVKKTKTKTNIASKNAWSISELMHAAYRLSTCHANVATSATAKCTVALIKDNYTENRLEMCYHRFSGVST